MAEHKPKKYFKVEIKHHIVFMVMAESPKEAASALKGFFPKDQKYGRPKDDIAQNSFSTIDVLSDEGLVFNNKINEDEA